jgi:uncharacterized protein (TIGR02391 family)
MKSLKTIQREIEAFIRTEVPIVDKLSKAAEKIQRACEKLDRSWSGSYAGYHGRLYFRAFEAPPLNLQFSPEWGGIQGIPVGWAERSPEEVKSAIEQLIGTNFSLDEIESLSLALAEQSEDFRTELLDEISGTELSHTSVERNLELLSELKDCKFGYSKDDFVKNQIPKTLASRDSRAVLQGVCIPSHIYFGGIGFEAQSRANAVRMFLKLLDRLSRCIERLEDEPAEPKEVRSVLDKLHPEVLAKCRHLYETGAFAEAVEKSFKIVKDRLRQLTGYESGSDAFGKTKLRIDGASAANVDDDFNRAVKFLTMAIDCFRNEKSHTSDAKIADPVRAFEYLTLSSLALNLLENARIVA